MNASMLNKHLIIQMFVVRQAPMHPAHCIMILSSVWPAVAGSMNVCMLKYLIIQMFVVLQAPMHACALHYDTIECLASRCWKHECVHA